MWGIVAKFSLSSPDVYLWADAVGLMRVRVIAFYPLEIWPTVAVCILNEACHFHVHGCNLTVQCDEHWISVILVLNELLIKRHLLLRGDVEANSVWLWA